MGYLRLLIVLALVASGCGEGDAPTRVVITVDNLVSCDIASSACQQGIYDSVAATLGAEEFSMPPVRTISVDQHAGEVRAGLDLNDLTGEDPQSRGLRLMGFLPPAADSLTEAQAEYFIEAIAAYYSRGSRSITVVDREYDSPNGQVILAHEFIHAIQDNQFDLDSVSRDANTEDGVIGVRSVIEGDAMYSSFAWYYDVADITLTDADWEADLALRTENLRSSLDDPSIALIDTASSFPYSFGFEYMTGLSLDGGLPSRASAFAVPPSTTAEVLAAGPIPGVFLDIPGPAHPAPLEGNSLENENRYGAWYVYGFLVRQGVSDSDAWDTAQRWLGDELAIYQNGDEVVAVWRVRFDDADEAGAFTGGVNANELDVARSAVAFGEDSYVFAAENTDTLLAWVEQPLDEMTASIVPKSALIRGGAVSAGGCLLPNEPALFDPHLFARSH